jgi:hypothetical protein
VRVKGKRKKICKEKWIMRHTIERADLRPLLPSAPWKLAARRNGTDPHPTETRLDSHLAVDGADAAKLLRIVDSP